MLVWFSVWRGSLLLALSFVGVLLACTPLLPLASNVWDTLVGDEEKRTVALYHQHAPAVINIRSTTLALDEYLNATKKGGLGSGVIVTPDGLAMTNFHVVRGAESLEATLTGDESPYTCTLLGADASKDIAIIRLEPRGPKQVFPFVRLADSQHLLVGQSVLAIGNPFGLKSTLTTGVVSSLNRQLPTQEGNVIEGVIQTDAAINPGNSGGALLNSHGELIGINTAIYSPSGSSAGIGFAVPTHVAKRILEDIQRYGHVRKPYLGVQLGLPLTPLLAKLLQLSVKQGVLIEAVAEGSPAQQAGLHGGTQLVTLPTGEQFMFGGDVLVAINDTPINDPTVAQQMINQHQPDEVLSFTIVERGQGSPKTVKITLGETRS